MDVRAINTDMVIKLLAKPGEPMTDGGYALRVLETRGRNSGLIRRIPLAVVQRETRWYLVSPVRTRDWVVNLLADPACAVLDGVTRVERRAQAVEGLEAAGAVAQYLRSMKVPWAIQAFPVTQDADETEIARHVPEMAVFELLELP
ncbi:nitroreductase/quinone reductase family protein [Amycolatopsis sp. NPDC004378]